MNVDGTVTQEATKSGLSRCIKVEVTGYELVKWAKNIWTERRLRSLEWTSSDVPMLAREITNLACLRVEFVAGRDLAANGRIEMSKGSGAVTIGWNWLIMDVVNYSHSVSFQSG